MRPIPALVLVALLVAAGIGGYLIASERASAAPTTSTTTRGPGGSTAHYSTQLVTASSKSYSPQDNPADCPSYPATILVSGTGSEIPGKPSLLNTTDEGNALGPPFDYRGLPTEHYDNGDISLSLYYLARGNATPVVAATATNAGQQVLNVTDFLIFGFVQGNADFKDVNVLQAHAIDLSPHPTWQGKCTGTEPPATTAQLLMPGQSITAYFSGTWSYLGSPINGFMARVNYELPGNPLGYSIDNNITWIR